MVGGGHGEQEHLPTVRAERKERQQDQRQEGLARHRDADEGGPPVAEARGEEGACHLEHLRHHRQRSDHTDELGAHPEVERPAGERGAPAAGANDLRRGTFCSAGCEGAAEDGAAGRGHEKDPTEPSSRVTASST
ncbi:MAG: hypothetical protein A2V77_21450 [Anaeromyxobacter sp. RBG_16_69_14]|nr:MAG: hypothetical protein A2V77_21450 [Anaeromyxobacter sp. RBG_16_69_14]